MATPFKNVFLPPGFKLPRYTIEKNLSSGGFGAVYLARHDDGRSVALKEFLPSLLPCRGPEDKGKIRCREADDEKRFREGLNVFFKEADTVAKIHDDRVIAILDVFEANGTAYFAMPVEQGETLQRLIRRQKNRLSDKRIQQIFMDAISGIQVLHEHGLLHLDIKPGNLWVRTDGSVVVLDLGASRDQEGMQKLGPPARTPGFAAPEQHRRIQTGSLTVQTDVYGLATSMYSCIERKPPPTAPERKMDDLPLAMLRKGQASNALLELIDQGMSLSMNERFLTAEAFKKALSRLPRLNNDTGELSVNYGCPPPLLPIIPPK